MGIVAFQCPLKLTVMKKTLIILALLPFFLVSCEKWENDIVLKVGSTNFRMNDIALYDSSSNIIYFKKGHDSFTAFLDCDFSFWANGDIVYQGSVVPSYSSYLPTGPVIFTPSFYGNYALLVSYGIPDGNDQRNDPKLMSAFEANGLLHQGLSVVYGAIEESTGELSFGFTVTNMDQTALYILDPVKMGPELFHYFTNGLYIYDSENHEIFSSTIQHSTPDPWDRWSSDWLTLLNPGESKTFTLTYPLVEPLPAGNYNAVFNYPGLSYQVSHDDLFQESGRIWLGDVLIKKAISFE